MPDATDSVNIINGGEMAASLSMEVKSLKLFGEDQVLGTDYTVTVNNGVYTKLESSGRTDKGVFIHDKL